MTVDSGTAADHNLETNNVQRSLMMNSSTHSDKDENRFKFSTLDVLINPLRCDSPFGKSNAVFFVFNPYYVFNINV